MERDLTNPYENLENSSYWRTGVADVHATRMEKIYSKKFAIGFDDKISAAGSCFAQHISRELRNNGYNTLDVEPLPAWLEADVAKNYGYGIYSARYGNVYTSRQLLQLVQSSLSGNVDQRDVWEKGGRYYDAHRPSVEPDGLDSPEEVVFHRRHHLAQVSKLLVDTDVLVFTLGLTETWELKADGTVYPTCPGVIAGVFDPEKYRFLNLNFNDVYQDMLEVRRLLMGVNPDIRMLLTVSPVPLTATASNDHVLVATMRSKSILRAVCAQLYDEFDNVDYFPSYEIITAPNARSFFFEPNLRSVTAAGVDVVMRSFFSEHPVRKQRDLPPEESLSPKPADTAMELRRRRMRRQREKSDVVCEEALLEAFNK